MSGPSVPAIAVLFVCTGNQCRSPMAAAMLRASLDERASDLTVESAGFVSEGTPPPRQVVDAMWAIGLDLSGHRSRLVDPAMLHAAELIIGMTRQHLIDLAVMAPSQWDHIFTFAELLRRAADVGGRQPGESVFEWAGRVHAGRARTDLLTLPLAEDIPDPMGGRLKAYERTRDELSGLTDRLTTLLTSA